jgi:hypothetical protein
MFEVLWWSDISLSKSLVYLTNRFVGSLIGPDKSEVPSNFQFLELSAVSSNGPLVTPSNFPSLQPSGTITGAQSAVCPSSPHRISFSDINDFCEAFSTPFLCRL